MMVIFEMDVKRPESSLRPSSPSSSLRWRVALEKCRRCYHLDCSRHWRSSHHCHHKRFGPCHWYHQDCFRHWNSAQHCYHQDCFRHLRSNCHCHHQHRHVHHSLRSPQEATFNIGCYQAFCTDVVPSRPARYSEHWTENMSVGFLSLFQFLSPFR